jgi:CBS domain containing-hemolysin-like protein
MSALGTLVEIGSIAGLVAANGFFVAAEIAIVKVRSTQIEPLVEDGVRRAKLAHHLVTHLDTYLSATQLGITFASLGLGWLGEPFVSRTLEAAFILVGITMAPWAVNLATVLGFVAITYLLIVFGELVPRFLAIQDADRFTLAVSKPLHIFYLVFKPFIGLLNRSSALILRWAGIAPPHEGDAVHSEDELRILLSRGLKGSSIGRAISLNAFDLRSRSIREVMIPRTSVVFLSTTRALETNIALALENQYTRYPLCEKDLDHVLGMVHLQELFRLKGQHGSGERLVEIKREILFVPETMNLDKLLTVFLTKRKMMAIVVDEYGGTAGLITLENVLEELVGDIHDEFDAEQSVVKKVGEGEYVVEGAMSLHDFAKMFDVTPDSRDVVTIGGYVIQLLGRVPERGTAFTLGGWQGTVDLVDGKRVRMLRLKKLAPSPSLEQEQKER